MSDSRYPRNEKLKQKKQIALLFDKGKWRSCGNLRIIFLDLNQKPQENLILENQKLGVSAAKRNFKKSVDRNRIKRLLREAYRHNKELYKNTFGENSLAMLFWTSRQKPATFQEVEKEFLNLCASKK